MAWSKSLSVFLVAVVLGACSDSGPGNGGGGGGGGTSCGTPDLELVAGGIGGSGGIDGTGIAARFDSPQGVAFDSAGNLYVADSRGMVVRKITKGGVVTTIAGMYHRSGDVDGVGSAARFEFPISVAVDANDNVYVSDWTANVIRKITPAGVVSTFAGTADTVGGADGTGAAARFSYPADLAFDGSGNLYVTDEGNTAIRKITPGAVVSTFVGLSRAPGVADGTGSAARFEHPGGIGFDGAGNLYLADDEANDLRKITPAGVVTTITTSGVTLRAPTDVAVDAGGNLYITNSAPNANQVVKVTGGVASILAGSPSGAVGDLDGTGTAALFSQPTRLNFGPDGALYIGDQFNQEIRKVTLDGVVTTIAGTAPPSAGLVNGSAVAARFNSPAGLDVDLAGNIFVADTGNNVIRKITSGGTVSTFAGSPGGYPGSTDGANALFDQPTDIAAAPDGSLYVVDQGNEAIRQVTGAGVVSTIAGSPGVLGSTDGVGTAARFDRPSAAALESSNLYLTDTFNDTIRRVDDADQVTTVAGTVGDEASADGSNALFDLPAGIAAGPDGALYVADTGNATIRRIVGTDVTTIAGAPGLEADADGVGAAAHFDEPSGIAVDAQGNVYVSERTSHQIRKLTFDGTSWRVTTLGGGSQLDVGIRLGPDFILQSPRALRVSGTSLLVGESNAVLELTCAASD